MIDNRFTFSVVGGLGALAGADLLQQFIRFSASDHDRYVIVFEQQGFPGDRLRADISYDPTGRKLHVFSLSRRLDARHRRDPVAVFFYQPDLSTRASTEYQRTYR
jgi:hypothetical protein